MKKLLALFITTLVFSCSGRALEVTDSTLAPPEKLPALTLKVGDEMPDTSGIEIVEVFPWHHLILGRGGEQHFKGDVDGIWTMEAFLYCDGKLLENPFGIYISELKVIYLDGDMNREIDEVIMVGSKRISIGETAPDCPLPATKI